MPAYKDENGRGTWYAHFRYVDHAGKTLTKKKRGFAKKRDALDYEEEFKRKNSRNASTMTFRSLVELFEDDRKHRNRNSTQGTTENILHTKLVPYFGNMMVGEITAGTIRQWQNQMLSAINPKNGKPFAPTYLRSINSKLSTVFNFGVQFCGLVKNPCRETETIGKKRAGEMSIWTTDEFNQVITKVGDRGKRIALMILYWGGLRVGECLALELNDMLPSSLAISISKTFRSEDDEDYDEGPKTDNSVRLAYLPDFVFKELEEYVGALYGIKDHDRIFYFGKGVLNRALNNAADKAGIKRIRIHDLRHSHAALLIELGYHIAVVADRLGDTIAIAQDTYAHLYPNKQAEVARTLSIHGKGLAPNTHAIHISDNGESFVLCPVCGEKINLESAQNQICSQNVPTVKIKDGET